MTRDTVIPSYGLYQEIFDGIKEDEKKEIDVKTKENEILIKLNEKLRKEIRQVKKKDFQAFFAYAKRERNMELKEIADTRKVSFEILEHKYRESYLKLILMKREFRKLISHTQPEQYKKLGIMDDLDKCTDKCSIAGENLEDYKKQYEDACLLAKETQSSSQSGQDEQQCPFQWELAEIDFLHDHHATRLKLKKLLKAEIEQREMIHYLEAQLKNLKSSNSLAYRKIQSKSTALAIAEKMLKETINDKEILKEENRKLIYHINNNIEANEKNINK